MLIQLILILIILAIIFHSLSQWRSRKIGRLAFGLWLLLWLAALIIVVFPKLTSWLANLVGIGRGADLVIYLALIAAFYLLFKLLMRLEKMEKDISKIVRTLALRDDNDKK